MFRLQVICWSDSHIAMSSGKHVVFTDLPRELYLLHCLGLLDFEDEGTTVYRNVGNHVSNDTA